MITKCTFSLGSALLTPPPLQLFLSSTLHSKSCRFNSSCSQTIRRFGALKFEFLLEIHGRIPL